MQLISASLEQINQLDSACFADPYPLSIWARYVEQPQRFSLIAFELNRILVGYACFSVLLPEAELLRVGVIPNSRGQGVAKRGLKQAQKQLADLGVDRVLLEVSRSNTAALKVYQRLGYTQDGIRPAYYKATPDSPAEDAILMSLSLT